MKKLRYILILAVLIAVLVPMTASAGGVFYCSTSISSGGSGTWGSPWACSTDDQLEYVVDDLICDNYYGGYLYQIFPNSYRYKVITWYDYGDCEVTYSADYAGYPPYSGVEVPTPYIIGAAALVGAGLLAAGIIWRRKRAAA